MKQTIPLIPLWKWMLELVLGSILFAILYGLGMSLQSIPRPTAECAAILFSAAVILVMFPLWIKLFEKQWRWDLLSRHAWKNIFCGIFPCRPEFRPKFLCDRRVFAISYLDHIGVVSVLVPIESLVL